MSFDDETTLDQLRVEVAELLGVPVSAVADDVPLPDQGLDSIRIMSLVERWRSKGCNVRFVEFAERPLLAEWSELIESAGGLRG
ncbi:phosphopantetheine-binding protein [Streptomyces chartreusis]|uniref:phosphopantetheine-binding protein n=1 Tax=Streptomyces chartreusis TaxID=1969 RepID=UPI00380A47A6